MRHLAACLLLLFACFGCAIYKPTCQKRLPEFVYIKNGFRDTERFSWTNGVTVMDAVRWSGGFDTDSFRFYVFHLDGLSDKQYLAKDCQITNNILLRGGDYVRVDILDIP